MRGISSRADCYDRFADVYDRHWTQTSRCFTSAVALILLPRLPGSARVLDLCCGTGVLLADLAAGGIEVVGLDGSRPMLEYARRRLPGATLVQADARCFGFTSVFDGVACMFDSLNHMLTVEELKAAFACVRASMAPGGWFLFDLNTETAYLEHWNDCERIIDVDMRITTLLTYRQRRRLGVFSVTIEHLVGGLVSTTEEIRLTQRCYSQDEILDALAMSALVLVDVLSFDGGALVSSSLPGAERLFYLCRKAA